MGKTSKPQLYCKEGTMAFIIPFTFEPIKSTEPDTCSKFFKEIEEKCYKDKQLMPEYQDEEALKILYEEYRLKLVNVLNDPTKHSKEHDLFQAAACAADSWPKKCGYKCEMLEYKGRNLCKCFAVSRKFHDDASQDTPRLEVYLGSYPVLYKNGGSEIIRFTIDAMLLLTKERGQNGTGFVLFNIHLKLDQNPEEGYYLGTDKFIFVKHLFYKNRLKCIIDNKEISLQKWTEQYLQNLFSILKIDFSKAINNYVRKEGAFKYSLIELNLKNSKILKVNLQDIKENYTQQIYGLLVGDEGWRHFPIKEVKYSHWSSREHSYSFFQDHNALIINVDNKEYNSSAQRWFKNYPDLYHTYPDLKPCFPGVSSLTFDAFVNAIYKEMHVDRTQEGLEVNNAEQNVKTLDELLQSYSTSLDEIKSLEDIICNQFSIPEKLKNLQDRYHRDATHVQDAKLYMLTQVTVSLSLVSVVVATFSVLLIVLGHNNSGLYTMISNTICADIVVVIISIIITCSVVWLSIELITRPKNWEFIKNLLSKPNDISDFHRSV